MATVKVGDRVDALFSDNRSAIGRVVAVDAHLVGVELDSGEIRFTAAIMCRIVEG